MVEDGRKMIHEIPNEYNSEIWVAHQQKDMYKTIKKFLPEVFNIEILTV